MVFNLKIQYVIKRFTAGCPMQQSHEIFISFKIVSLKFSTQIFIAEGDFCCYNAVLSR